ncbi:MAG TPA: hypothetical protein VHM91_22500 [Verrucomicrobiales bacterium]|jgi:hypothetical protein|nr:hypothetical protein [Verrucomicrobiales bacterium]
MNTQGSASQLESAWRDLAAAWQHTTDDWRDAKSKEFEARFLEKLPGLLTGAKQAIEDIDILLRKMRHDCE